MFADLGFPEDSPFIECIRRLGPVALRMVRETLTIADVASGKLPARVQRLVDDPDAWAPRLK